MGEVVVEVPVEQVLVGAQQEGAGATGGVDHAQIEGLGGGKGGVGKVAVGFRAGLAHARLRWWGTT